MKIVKSFLLMLVLIGGVFLVSCGEEPPTNLNEFATCLTENGAEMYGAEWCSHCKDQKAMFGEAFKNVNYIECPQEQQKCQEAGIKGYPTWKFADGTALPGAQQFSKLAEKTGCSLP